MLLTQRYSEKILGVLSSYDRVVIQGTNPGMVFQRRYDGPSECEQDQDL